jgi:proteasome alpha subunit
VFDEPYRWIDAIHQRRDYIAEQLDRAAPVVGLSLPEGILLATFHRQNPKIFEIYDRIGMAGIGHPADLETIRGLLLNMAHVEGFQRSSSDVSVERLSLFGLAPKLKAAFEDISVPPIILDVLLAEVGRTMAEDRFVQIAYDGNISRGSHLSVLAPTEEIASGIMKDLTTDSQEGGSGKPLTLANVLPRLRVLFLRTLYTQEDLGTSEDGTIVSPDRYAQCDKRLTEDRTWEGILLDRANPARIRRILLPPSENHVLSGQPL